MSIGNGNAFCLGRGRLEGKGREGKGREGKGREGKGREGKGREGKGREGKGREGKGREGKGSLSFKSVTLLEGTQTSRPFHARLLVAQFPLHISETE